MGLRGVVNLQKFIEDGGVFVPITNCSRLPIDYGIVTGVAIQDPRQLQARGSVYNATFADRRSPIAYGYSESLPIYFNQAPLFQVGGGGGFGGGGGEGPGGGGGAGARPSGRGTLTDPDIVSDATSRAADPPDARTVDAGATPTARRVLRASSDATAHHPAIRVRREESVD